MLVVLKIPVVYLCAVVWWAIKAEPRPLDGVARAASPEPPPECDWRERVRNAPRPPRGSRGRRKVAPRRVVSA